MLNRTQPTADSKKKLFTCSHFFSRNEENVHRILSPIKSNQMLVKRT